MQAGSGADLLSVLQVGGREQILEGYGWKMLPGLYPTGKALELDVSYKVSAIALVSCQRWNWSRRSSTAHCF